MATVCTRAGDTKVFQISTAESVFRPKNRWFLEKQEYFFSQFSVQTQLLVAELDDPFNLRCLHESSWLKRGGQRGDGEIISVCCALHHSLLCFMSGGPGDAAARRAGGTSVRGGLAPSPSRPPNPLLTARGLLAGRHKRAEREREGVCVRV